MAQGFPARVDGRSPGAAIWRIALLTVLLTALMPGLSGEPAFARDVSSDEAMLFLGRDFTGPSKTWSLAPDQPFLAIPYTGDAFQPVSASIKLGAEVGVVLFEQPFFTSTDETCDYRLGRDDDPALWWLSDKIVVVPGAPAAGPVEANLPPQQIASLILYRRTLGPPPGVLLLERRRYVNWDCQSPTKARGYKRLFVPVAAAPHRQGCFNLDAALDYGGSDTVALEFSAASELLLIEPRDLDARYDEIDHRFTAGLYRAKDCAGEPATFSLSQDGARRFDLKPFGLDRKARSLSLRYDQGPFDPMLVSAEETPDAPEPGAAEKTAESAAEAPAGTSPEAASEPAADDEAQPQDVQAAIVPAEEVQPENIPAANVPTEVGEAEPEDVPAAIPVTAAEAAAETPSAAPDAEPAAGAERETAVEAASQTAAMSTPEPTPEPAPEPAAMSAPPPASKQVSQAAASGDSAEAEPAVATSEAPAAAEPVAPAVAAAPKAEEPADDPEAAPSLNDLGPAAEPAPTAEAPAEQTPAEETAPDETTKDATTGFLVLPEDAPESEDGAKSFKFPLLQGYRLSACLYQQQDCGEPAASEWCRARGFAGGASAFEIDENIGSLFPTLALGDLQLCANFVCDGFKEITCQP
jgi:hypothetical protein